MVSTPALHVQRLELDELRSAIIHHVTPVREMTESEAKEGTAQRVIFRKVRCGGAEAAGCEQDVTQAAPLAPCPSNAALPRIRASRPPPSSHPTSLPFVLSPSSTRSPHAPFPLQIAFNACPITRGFTEVPQFESLFDRELSSLRACEAQLEAQLAACWALEGAKSGAKASASHAGGREGSSRREASVLGVHSTWGHAASRRHTTAADVLREDSASLMEGRETELLSSAMLAPKEGNCTVGCARVEVSWF